MPGAAINPALPPDVPGKDDGGERDHALLRRIAQQDRRAFEALYRDYHRRLARFLTRTTRQSELIDEVINETFWIVWQKADQFRGEARASTWIFGIAYRCALKALRRNGAASEPLAAEFEDLGASQQQEQHELRDWVDQGLRHLPQEQRTTIELAYYLGSSCEEIAQIMECSVGTVKARMFHARVKLRNLLPALG